MKKNKKETNQKYDKWIIIALTVIVILLWDTIFVYPIKLFVVLFHEISHGFTAIITGGTINQIQLSFNLSGKTITNGGNLLLIASSGYLGSLVIGVLLFISSDNLKYSKLLTAFLAIVLLLVSINLLKGGLEIFVSLIIAIILFIIPRYLHERYSNFLLKFLGLTSCLYVITDIRNDLFATTLRETDSQVIELITGIPSILVGIVWLIISIVTVLWLFRKSILTKAKK